jgi:thermostable 8-oxoguanine DNA glycosylase
MSQRAVVFAGPTVVEFELPAPSDELLPGLRWGAVEAFPTPAYWAYQVLARRVLAGPPRHRLGQTLAEEVVACLLGGHGISAEIALAAFSRLQSSSLLGHTPTAAVLEEALRLPLTINGRDVHYRFACRKATFIAAALRVLADVTPPQDEGRHLRDWLLRLDGVGYKTASWVARNWLSADDVAILDVHVMRAGTLGGFLDSTLDLPRDYLVIENQFLRFSEALGVRPSELDAVIWQEMKWSPRTVRRLLSSQVQRGVVPPISAACANSDKRSPHAS